MKDTAGEDDDVTAGQSLHMLSVSVTVQCPGNLLTTSLII